MQISSAKANSKINHVLVHYFNILISHQISYFLEMGLGGLHPCGFHIEQLMLPTLKTLRNQGFG